uniref:Uncharacterized protein n=1 Tax=Ditylenchus dipsaci TaxID=166011 RepID=A0A915E236_9BILA
MKTVCLSVPGSDNYEEKMLLYGGFHFALVADGEIYIKYAHFDCEPAAYQPFQQKFDKPVKLCSFHVKSAINRKLSNAEKENADDVHRNRQQPRQRSQESARFLLRSPVFKLNSSL